MRFNSCIGLRAQRGSRRFQTPRKHVQPKSNAQTRKPRLTLSALKALLRAAKGGA